MGSKINLLDLSNSAILVPEGFEIHDAFTDSNVKTIYVKSQEDKDSVNTLISRSNNLEVTPEIKIKN